MREVGGVILTPEVIDLKKKEDCLSKAIQTAHDDQRGELLWKRAETRTAIGDWYLQKVCETMARGAKADASKDRRDAAVIYGYVR